MEKTPDFIALAGDACPGCLAQLEEIVRLQDMVIARNAQLIRANQALLENGLSTPENVAP